MNINQIISAIHGMDEQDITKVIQAVKYARSQNHRQATRTMKVGDIVEFTNKRGALTSGVVKKVAIKYVTVDCGIDGRWKVPAGMLKVREAA